MEPEDDKEHDEQEILKQDLEVGTEVAKGTNITLYIPDVIVEYPDFTDGTWTENDIQEFCKQYEINVEFKHVARAGYQEGEIISQSRPKETTVVKGVTITITVATAMPEEETKTEDTNKEENNNSSDTNSEETNE